MSGSRTPYAGVNLSRDSRGNSIKGRRSTTGRGRRFDATSSDEEEDYSDHDDNQHNRSRCRNDKRSKSIIKKLRGDLAECDNIQSIHITKLLQEKAAVDATNQELVVNLKQLRSQLAAETAAKSELSLSFKLQESENTRLSKDTATLSTRLAELSASAARLQTQFDTAAQEYKHKKDKHRQETHALQEEKERYREQVGVLRARLEESERTIKERDERVRDEAERADKAEQREAKARDETDAWRRALEETKENCGKMEAEISELNVRLEYETAGKADYKDRLETLTNELIEKEKSFELQKQELRGLNERTLLESEEELKEIIGENNELKGLLSKSEERVAQLEAVLEQMKTKIEDTTHQLTATEGEVGGLMRDRDQLAEVKALLAEREKELDSRREGMNVDSPLTQRLEKDVLVLNGKLEHRLGEWERLGQELDLRNEQIRRVAAM